MMDHERYRMRILAEPRSSDPALREHRESCEECALYTQRLLRFESRLERALEVDVPAAAQILAFAPKGRRRAAPAAWRPLAMAAGVLICLVVAAGVWLALPGTSLAADVVAHMAGEPQAWRRTDAAVPDSQLNAVLRESQLQLAPAPGTVSYASSCLFRGHYVPHLVVQTESGPVTVMVLVHESVHQAVRFDEHGYRGTIVPVQGHGSIAVLMQDPAASGDEVLRIAAKVRDSILWTR